MYAQNINSIVGQEDIESPYDLVRLARRGVTWATLKTVSKGLGVRLKELVPKLPIGERTLQRYNEQQCLPSHVSEQIIQWAQIILFGNAVFESEKVFQDWMRSFNRALGKCQTSRFAGHQAGSRITATTTGAD